MIKFTIAIIVCATFFGCAGSCITLGGTYKDAKGEITWCKDASASNDVGRDVLVNNDDGEKAIIVTESEMQKINEQLNDVPAVKAKKITEKKTVLETFLEHLK